MCDLPAQKRAAAFLTEPPKAKAFLLIETKISEGPLSVKPLGVGVWELAFGSWRAFRYKRNLETGKRLAIGVTEGQKGHRWLCRPIALAGVQLVGGWDWLQKKCYIVLASPTPFPSITRCAGVPSTLVVRRSKGSGTPGLEIWVLGFKMETLVRRNLPPHPMRECPKGWQETARTE
jgi:hypothetical protein